MILNNRIKKVSSSKKTIKQLAQFLLLAIIFLPSSTFGIANGQKQEQSITANLSLRLDSHNPIAVSEKKVEIKPGESLADASKRIASEEEAKKRVTVIAREKRVYLSVVSDAVYQTAATRFGIADWRYLKAIHFVETGCSSDPNKRSYAGASGPMQFLPSTWRFAGVDGDGDNQADIGNVVDAIHGAANYLAMSGGQSNIRQSLYSYNHSTSYVNKVTAVALSIGS